MIKLKMVPGKVRKSFLKRFKVTKKGKLLKRSPGVNHFRVKKDKDLVRDKRKLDKGPDYFIEYSYY